MKIDPYKHKERYLKWRESVKDGIPHMNKYNSDLILKYLNDMENGINVYKDTPTLTQLGIQIIKTF